MEGKELYSNEDEELNPKHNKDEDDGDDFGLPEIEDTDDKSSDLGDPYAESGEEKKEEEDYSYSDSSDDDTSSTDTSEDDYTEDTWGNDADAPKDEDKSSYYEEEYGQKKNPVGWIIFGLFVVIAIVIGGLWWFNREPEPKKEIVKVAPVIEQPVQEQEPEIIEVEPEPEPEKQAGVFEINELTGRYHVIVASSIDKDLIHDYGTKLANQGMTCNILAPLGNKKFHRLSVADFELLNDASSESEGLKSTLGEDVWVIRY